MVSLGPAVTTCWPVQVQTAGQLPECNLQHGGGGGAPSSHPTPAHHGGGAGFVAPLDTAAASTLNIPKIPRIIDIAIRQPGHLGQPAHCAHVYSPELNITF